MTILKFVASRRNAYASGALYIINIAMVCRTGRNITSTNLHKNLVTFFLLSIAALSLNLTSPTQTQIDIVSKLLYFLSFYSQTKIH
jgi:hypothetical protein